MASHSWKDAYRGMSADNIKGLILALSSSLFIGASFIVKKKGLKKAGASGIRAGGYSYRDLFLFAFDSSNDYDCDFTLWPAGNSAPRLIKFSVVMDFFSLKMENAGLRIHYTQRDLLIYFRDDLMRAIISDHPL